MIILPVNDLSNAASVPVANNNEMQVVDVKFGSRARKLGVEQADRVVALKLPNTERPAPYWVFSPARAIAALVWWLQGWRVRRRATLQPV